MALTQQRDERYTKQLSKMKRPIPGQSLTNDPNNPKPFEGPPEFTKKRAALEEIFSNMIREQVYVPLMEAVSGGTPIMEIVQVLLFEGFRKGKWNPDLFLLLIEPTAYMIMALAERAGIEYRIDREEESGFEESQVERKLQSVSNSIEKGKIKSGVLPNEIEEEIEELPADSLLSKTQKTTVGESENPSLINRNEGEQ